MATNTTTSAKISLKLLVDKSSKKVLFAEAGKDFVDFLFGLLELPIGTILNLLVEHGMVGCGSLGRVSQSVQALDHSYLQSNQTKASLFSPNIASSNTKQTLLLQQLAYKNQGSSGPSVDRPTPTHRPNPFGSSAVSFQAATNIVEGYVKGMVNYMVMDDLMVKPMSTISSITLLNTFEIKDIGCLQEKTVQLDIKKALKLVKASFESSTVLTDVFLGKN